MSARLASVKVPGAVLAAAALICLAAVMPASGAAGATVRTRARVRVGRLSLKQLAGQRVIFSYSGLTPPASLLARIKAGEAAGVIFFSGNISSPTQIRRVIGKLQRAASESSVKAPLLMMTDQEGGLVRRLPGAPTLSEKEVGDAAHPASAASQAGRAAGLNLEAAGMNANLAPVLDVYRRPGNFIDQYGRSFGMNPQKVAAVIGGELRRRLGFTGVTITDALEAGALRRFGGIPNRAVLAADAGMDLLLCAAQSVNEGTGAVDALASALRSGRLGSAAFYVSVARAIALRSALGS